MPYRFDSKVVIVTGAASGIGRATAIKLASLGATLAISDINNDALAETAKQCEGRGHSSSHLDVSSSSACSKFIEDVIAQHGQIDHIFNCAGVNPTSYNLEDTTDEYWDKIINTNLKGTYAITRAAVPHLKSGSSLVNVSSILGVKPGDRVAIYSASKFGVIGFSKSMALELGPKGIRVNAVAPGYIDTPTNAGVVEGPESVKRMEKKIAMRRLGTAQEVADVVAFLMSEEARYVNGSVVEINGGIA